ncbi:DUF6855 family protein [Clavibacter michiganensis]|uniref:DUF6855 family protein n=1 Tax=Clavibacter michiganensis TaxID=28447 RepID=UPI00339B6E89
MRTPPGGSGTGEDPWTRTTPPGASEHSTHLDEDADPDVLVGHAGSTIPRCDGHAVEDLRTWLFTRGSCVPLGAADERTPVAVGSVRARARSPQDPLGGQDGPRAGTGVDETTAVATGGRRIGRRR